MNICKLYKIDDEVVFYSPALTNNRQGRCDGLTNGTKIGYATDGSTMEPSAAVLDFLNMADVQPPRNNIEAVYRNMEVAKIMIAVVRSEMIATDLASLGVSSVELLGKLSDVIDAINVGMFKEGRSILATVQTDAFLTTERIAKYDAMLESSDAIDYEVSI